jgi:pilus assembly protein Flp/PilA
MFSLSSKKKNEKGQGLVEYALILVLVAIVVIAALMILGPIIGNVFSKVNTSLSTVSIDSGAAAVAAAPLTGCPSVHPDGYATGPGYGWDCYSPTAGAYDMP